MTMPCSTPSAITPTRGDEREQRAPTCAHRRVAAQRADVHQRQRGRDHHRRERRLRQVGEQRVEEQQQHHDEAGADEPGQLALRARLLGDRGTRAARRDGEALEEARRRRSPRRCRSSPGSGRPRRRAAPRSSMRVAIVSVSDTERDADRGDAAAARRRGPTSTGRRRREARSAARRRSRRPRTTGRAPPTPTVAPTTATSTAGTCVVQPRQHEQHGEHAEADDAAPRPLVWSRSSNERADLVEEAVGVGREAEQLRELADDDRDREAVHVADLHLAREQVGDEAELGRARARSR